MELVGRGFSNTIERDNVVEMLLVMVTIEVASYRRDKKDQLLGLPLHWGVKGVNMGIAKSHVGAQGSTNQMGLNGGQPKEGTSAQPLKQPFWNQPIDIMFEPGPMGQRYKGAQSAVDRHFVAKKRGGLFRRVLWLKQRMVWGVRR